MSFMLLRFFTPGVGYGGGLPACDLDEAGNVGATTTKYCVCASCPLKPIGMNVWVVKG